MDSKLDFITDDDQFPEHWTGYKQLRKTPQGRQELKEKGYVVRSSPARSGPHAARGKYSCFLHNEFIGWDGEGCNDSFGKHHYILLAASTGDYLISDDGDSPTGLGTSECFDLFLDVAEQHPNSYHVIYAGNYDTNKILKDLIYSEHRLRKLYDTNGVFYKHYHIEWVPGKWLKIRCLRTKRSITLFDVISFFQSTFVNTLESWNIKAAGFHNIEQMKKKRGQFRWEDRKKVLKYCMQELAALVQLMTRFRDNHIAAGLPKLSGFYGPGAIANSLLKRYSVQKYMLSTNGTKLNRAALVAYAAGRIERLRYGTYNGRVKIFDINSAYPWSISRLPDLRKGWGRSLANKTDCVPMSLYHVKVYHHDKYASPLFYRKGLAKTRPIFFPNPQRTNFIESWIWTPEYENLLRFNIPHEVIEAYLFRDDNPIRPFTFVEDLYYQRLEWKTTNNPAEKNLKLAINSLYGKFVQQAGYNRQGEIPKYHQLEWGGYVTSETRAKLYAAIASIDFRGVVGMETDSIIVAGNRSPNVPISQKLGEWGITDYDGITYIQSGVYWLSKNGEWLDRYSKRRGYLPGTLTRDKVIEAWNSNPNGDDTIHSQGNAIGMVVDARGKTFITIGHCYRPGQNFDKWGDWEEGPKKLSLWKTNKRYIKRGGNPATHLLDTEDQTDFSGWSSPYTLEWNEDDGV